MVKMKSDKNLEKNSIFEKKIEIEEKADFSSNLAIFINTMI